MRKMMSLDNGAMTCMDENGVKHPHGDKWNKDDCTRCKCRVSIKSIIFCYFHKYSSDITLFYNRKINIGVFTCTCSLYK